MIGKKTVSKKKIRMCVCVARADPNPERFFSKYDDDDDLEENLLLLIYVSFEHTFIPYTFAKHTHKRKASIYISFHSYINFDRD